MQLLALLKESIHSAATPPTQTELTLLRQSENRKKKYEEEKTISKSQKKIFDKTKEKACKNKKGGKFYYCNTYHRHQ